MLCLGWPATTPAPPTPTGISATPTLILSGNDDLRTPYEQDLTMMGGYTNAQLLRVPDTGHSTTSTDQTGCAKNAMIDFLATGHAPPSCPGTHEPQALPLPPTSLQATSPVPSTSRLSGQVATAALMTIEDVFGQASLVRGGGLHGGYWALSRKGFALHSMTDVPGVALSGTIHVADPTGHLQIAGYLTVRGCLAGKLTLRGRTVTGRIGGASVHARLAAL